MHMRGMLKSGSGTNPAHPPDPPPPPPTLPADPFPRSFPLP